MKSIREDTLRTQNFEINIKGSYDAQNSASRKQFSAEYDALVECVAMLLKSGKQPTELVAQLSELLASQSVKSEGDISG